MKYGPRSQGGVLIKALLLLIIEEAFITKRVLFEHVDTILKDLRPTGQSISRRSKPYFGGLTVGLAGYYMQFIPVVTSLKLDVESSSEARDIPSVFSTKFRGDLRYGKVEDRPNFAFNLTG